MAKTHIFLSSTCFDLKALREHVRSSIEQLGHELLASELSSFPISPNLTTVENCKKVVRERADLLVLVVGGRRGSSDSAGRSVVSAEYQESRRKGIDAFVFVDRRVWECAELYEKNPTADFSSVVDHPDVFKFLGELKKESRWLYTFSSTSEIIETLKTQLSVYLRMLIEQKRAGVLAPPRGFDDVSDRVLKLIQERPRYWEHLLTCELLDNAFAAASNRLNEIRAHALVRRVEVIPLDEAPGRLSGLFADAANIANAMHPALAALTASWGPLGVAGKPTEIKAACDRVAAVVDGLVDWEADLRYLKFPDEVTPAVRELEGSMEEFIQQLGRIPYELRSFVELPEEERKGRTLDLQLKITAPPQLKRFNDKIQQIRQR